MILSLLLVELVTLYAISLNEFDMVLKTSMCVESVDRNCYSCYLPRTQGLLIGTHHT